VVAVVGSFASLAGTLAGGFEPLLEGVRLTQREAIRPRTSVRVLLADTGPERQGAIETVKAVVATGPHAFVALDEDPHGAVLRRRAAVRRGAVKRPWTDCGRRWRWCTCAAPCPR